MDQFSTEPTGVTREHISPDDTLGKSEEELKELLESKLNK